MRHIPTLLAAILLAAAPAFAAPDLEKEMMVATGKAVAKMIFGTKEEARAECEAGRAQLSAKTPKYLAAYVEACVALTVSPFGPEKKPESCPYYRRAVDIWRDSPPPKASDEVALKRAGKLKQWKDAVAGCPNAAVVKTKSAPIACRQRHRRNPSKASLRHAGRLGGQNFDETGGHELQERCAEIHCWSSARLQTTKSLRRKGNAELRPHIRMGARNSSRVRAFTCSTRA
jgi:hypothetical protein